MVENELLLKRTLRDEMMKDEKLEVLDNVKCIMTIPNTILSTLEQVADYYEVGDKAINSLMGRNKEELESNGLKILKGTELKAFKGKLQDETILKQLKYTSQLALFSKRAILNVGMILEGSLIADKIKQELGISSNWNTHLKKETKFKKELNNMIKIISKNLYSEEYNKVIVDKNKALKNMLKYQTQYDICNNKYRIDFYFPLLNIAVEYDENYHNTNKQKEKDNIREYEIMREIYINKYYEKVDLNEINICIEEVADKLKSLEELFDYEYNNKILEYSFDITNFIRVKENNEFEAMFKLNTIIVKSILENLNSCGMSCDYSDYL